MIISMPFSGVCLKNTGGQVAAHSTRHSAGSIPGHSRQREKIPLPNLIKNSLTVFATYKNCVALEAE